MEYIINPLTNESFSIFEQKGKLLLKQYVNVYQSGGAVSEQTTKQEYKQNLEECEGKLEVFKQTYSVMASTSKKIIAAKNKRYAKLKAKLKAKLHAETAKASTTGEPEGEAGGEGGAKASTTGEPEGEAGGEGGAKANTTGEPEGGGRAKANTTGETANTTGEPEGGGGAKANTTGETAKATGEPEGGAKSTGYTIPDNYKISDAELPDIVISNATAIMTTFDEHNKFRLLGDTGYLFGPELFVGGFKQVFIGKKKDDATPLALAIMKSSNINRTENEMNCLKHLNHAHILKGIELIKISDDRILMVTEYASKGDLRFMIMLGLSEKYHILITKLLIQICESLKYLKDKNVHHRDVKLANFVLTADNVVKVIDFGVSTICPTTNDTQLEKATSIDKEDRHKVSHKLSTLTHLAPEYSAIMNINDYEDEKLDVITSSHEFDIFALGICILQIFAQTPIKSKTPLQAVWNSLGRDNLESLIDQRLQNNFPNNIISGLFTNINKLLFSGEQLIQKILEPDMEKRAKIEDILRSLKTSLKNSFAKSDS
jgi:hypothetical protein